MPFIVAAVVLVGLLGVLNLLLTLAAIRRLGQHAADLAMIQEQLPAPGLLTTGTPLPAFTARSVDGAVVDSETVPPRVVGFLSTTCSACIDQLPALTSYLRKQDVERGTAVVVVVGPDNADAERFVGELTAVATVVREPYDGPIGTACSAKVFPAFYLISDGAIRAGAVSVARLAEPVPA